MITSPASAISRELKAVAAAESVNQGQLESIEDNQNSEVLPLPEISKAGFELPAGFVPLAAREDVLNLLLTGDLGETLTDKLSNLDISLRAKPKLKFSAQRNQLATFQQFLHHQLTRSRKTKNQMLTRIFQGQAFELSRSS